MLKTSCALSAIDLSEVTGGIFNYSSDWGLDRLSEQMKLGATEGYRNTGSGAGALAGGVATAWGDAGRQALGIRRWAPTQPK